MKTIALRFGETFSPKCGTIAAHQEKINDLGYVWYGKMGCSVSDPIVKEIMQQKRPKILLIRSGKQDRYWAYIAEISKEVPAVDGIPTYYADRANEFKTWFKIVRFEYATKDVMSNCRVISSGKKLGEVSKHSMNPYYIIDYNDELSDAKEGIL